MRTRALIVVAALLAAAACTDPPAAQDQTTVATSPPGTSATSSTTEKDPGRANRNAKPYAETIDVAIADIQDFWSDTMQSAYGQAYAEIPESKIFAASSRTDAGPSCSPEGGRADYKDVQNNAYYCRLGSFIAYDDENLFPRIYKQFGAFAVAMVLAHEFGHAVQDQVKLLGGRYPTVLTEVQADCFAGAWTRNALDNPEDTGFKPTEADLQSALAGMIEFRDKPGKDPLERGAHGNGFDRVNGFQTGFEEGAGQCVTFTETPPTITEGKFRTPDERASGGNLPFGQALDIATKDLDAYWSSLGSTYDFDFRKVGELKAWKEGDPDLRCGDKTYKAEQIRNTVFFCEADNYIAYDDVYLEDLHANIGDFGPATLLAEQWAVSAQYQDGQDRGKIESRDGRLQQGCFAGAWARAVWDGDEHGDGLSLSPGDLDESIRAFLAGSEKPDEKGQTATGSAFERIAAFRDGFLSEAPEQTCASYSEQDTAPDRQ